MIVHAANVAMGQEATSAYRTGGGALQPRGPRELLRDSELVVALYQATQIREAKNRIDHGNKPIAHRASIAMRSGFVIAVTN